MIAAHKELQHGCACLASWFERAVRAIYPDRGPSNLHPGQWAVLRILANEQRSPLTVDAIARSLGVTHAPASRAVASLVKRKLVSTEKFDGDRRVRQVRLTPAGSSHLRADPLARLSAAIEALPDDTRVHLEKALVAVIAQLSE